MISKDLIKEFQNLILNWSKENLMDYPWRSNRNPYKVLISEIFLTRTKAQQVLPIFIIFIKNYPTIEDFLDMDINIVSNIIQPLGLLFRSNYLRDIAKLIKSEFKGKIPDKFSELIRLKGIGYYGANAILCFGYNKKYPLLDSNFIKIFYRVFEVKSKTKTPKTDKYLWNFSKNLLPDKNYIDFSYGILDIGGNLCLSSKPKCDECPLHKICIFYKKSKI